MSRSKVDRELAELEARAAERAEQEGALPQKRGVRQTLKRVAKDVLVRRTSTKH
jgi:hypothetical protein